MNAILKYILDVTSGVIERTIRYKDVVDIYKKLVITHKKVKPIDVCNELIGRTGNDEKRRMLYPKIAYAVSLTRVLLLKLFDALSFSLAVHRSFFANCNYGFVIVVNPHFAQYHFPFNLSINF